MRKTKLKSKKNLSPKKPLQKTRTHRKKDPNSVSQLKKKADGLMSLYVIYRDGEYRDDGWWSQCITCERWVKLVYTKLGEVDRRPIHWGHFQSSRHNITRYDEMNIHAQCSVCNIRNQGEQFRYSQAIDERYGEGTAKELEALAKAEHRFSKEELAEIIHDAIERIEHYKAHP